MTKRDRGETERPQVEGRAEEAHQLVQLGP